jgi:OHCU decarboxylase
VDFHDERNVIILAVSLGFAVAPTVYPTITSGFNEGVRTIISSGITLGAIAAILLNLLLNVWGGDDNLVSRFMPSREGVTMLTIDQVNQMDRDQFVAEFGGLFQKSPWVAEQAYEARPFGDVYDLRKALQDAVFDAPPERQLELIRSYPQLGSVFSDLTPANRLSVADQAMAGLDRLDNDEHQTLDSLTQAYQEKFGFPMVMAVRENTKETIMRTGNARLQNSPAAERATALVEIAKIANLRLLDRVEEPDYETVRS